MAKTILPVDTTTLDLHLSVTVDTGHWIDTYGPAQEDVPANVIGYIASTLNDSAAADEAGLEVAVTTARPAQPRTVTVLTVEAGYDVPETHVFAGTQTDAQAKITDKLRELGGDDAADVADDALVDYLTNEAGFCLYFTEHTI